MFGVSENLIERLNEKQKKKLIETFNKINSERIPNITTHMRNHLPLGISEENLYNIRLKLLENNMYSANNIRRYFKPSNRNKSRIKKMPVSLKKANIAELRLGNFAPVKKNITRSNNSNNSNNNKLPGRARKVARNFYNESIRKRFRLNKPPNNE